MKVEKNPKNLSVNSFGTVVGLRERITLGTSGKVVLAFSPDAERYLADMVTDHERNGYLEELTHSGSRLRCQQRRTDPRCRCDSRTIFRGRIQCVGFPRGLRAKRKDERLQDRKNCRSPARRVESAIEDVWTLMWLGSVALRYPARVLRF